MIKYAQKITLCNPFICEFTFAAYGLGTVAVFIVSFASVIGFFILPCLPTIIYEYTMAFFIALAYGTLFGDGVLHLLPRALCFSGIGSRGPSGRRIQSATVLLEVVRAHAHMLLLVRPGNGVRIPCRKIFLGTLQVRVTEGKKVTNVNSVGTVFRRTDTITITWSTDITDTATYPIRISYSLPQSPRDYPSSACLRKTMFKNQM